jgi:ABC-type iron transport system FetAB ATPase subunit
MIEFANVSLVRGRTEILKNVSFKAEKGKIIITTPDGAAQQTLQNEKEYKAAIDEYNEKITELTAKIAEIDAKIDEICTK